MITVWIQEDLKQGLQISTLAAYQPCDLNNTWEESELNIYIYIIGLIYKQENKLSYMTNTPVMMINHENGVSYHSLLKCAVDG